MSIFKNAFTVDLYQGENFDRQLATAEHLDIAIAAYEAALTCDRAYGTIVLRQRARVMKQKEVLDPVLSRRR